MEKNKAILILDKIDKKISTIIFGICIALLSIATLIICTQVFGRYVLGISSEAMEELCRYLIIWAAFLVSAPMVTEGGHIILDVLVAQIKNKRVLLFLNWVLTPIVTITVAVCLVVFGFQLVINTGDIRTTSLIFPQKFPYSLLPVAMIFEVIFGIIKLIKGVYYFATHQEGAV